ALKHRGPSLSAQWLHPRAHRIKPAWPRRTLTSTFTGVEFCSNAESSLHSLTRRLNSRAPPASAYDDNRCPPQRQGDHCQKRPTRRAHPENGSEATESAEKDRSPERTEQYRLSLNRWEYRIHRDAKARPETAVESQVAVEADGKAAAQVKRIAQP